MPEPAARPPGCRSFASLINSTLVTEEERSDIVGGAPFEDGLSTARLYYSVAPVYDSRGPGRGQPVPGLWMYTYHIFYSWNGCSNQDFSLSLNGTRNVVQYLLCTCAAAGAGACPCAGSCPRDALLCLPACLLGLENQLPGSGGCPDGSAGPWGVHEGDWEHIVVLVCDGDDSIQQVGWRCNGGGGGDVRRCAALRRNSSCLPVFLPAWCWFHLAHIRACCFHGSPLSKHANRMRTPCFAPACKSAADHLLTARLVGDTGLHTGGAVPHRS